MKTLVYGIDGITLEILQKISPDFSEYIENFQIHDIKDDTLGRGWSKIYTGQPPQVTNAFFQMPVADGSYKIDKNYSLNSPGAAAEGRFEYLWDVSDRLGLNSVFVNMPTASPAPSQGTAFVSGIGGGRYPQDGIDEDLYHPSDLASLINEKYKLDMRLTSQQPEIVAFCENLNSIHHAQTEVFIEICEKKNADFGFYVNKVTIELLFLAYFDLCAIDDADPTVKEALLNHFQSIFKDFKEIIERCKPDDVIFVADHGTVGYKYDFNLDLLLERLGFLSFVENTGKKAITSKIAAYLPTALKTKLKKRMNIQNKRFPLRTPTAKSLAFSTVFDTGNFCGIYLNDYRFGGQTQRADQTVITQICVALNATPEFRVLELYAKPFAARTIDSPFGDGSPDIHVQKPDEVFCQRVGETILSVNTRYGPISPNIGQYGYPNSGVKSSKALLASNFSADKTPSSLCDAYHLIVQSMEEAAK